MYETISLSAERKPTMTSIYVDGDFYIMADLTPADFYTRGTFPLLKRLHLLILFPQQ